MTCSSIVPAQITDWFREQGWTPFSYQKACWQAFCEGKHGMIRADTGMGKTYAALMGPVVEHLREVEGRDALDELLRKELGESTATLALTFLALNFHAMPCLD